jgi:protein TonB
MHSIQYQNYKRWFASTSSAFLIIFIFMIIFLRVEPVVKLQSSPYLVLDYITLPPPPKVEPKKPPKPKPPPKVLEKKEQPPEPPPLAKAPVEVSEASPVPTQLISAPVAEKPKPSVVEDIKHLDNTEFTPIYNPRPTYPSIARAAGIEGYVIVELLIDEKGKVKSFSILRTSGHQQFALETAKVVRRWRFPPPRIDGRPSQVKYEYKVVFKLE